MRFVYHCGAYWPVLRSLTGSLHETVNGVVEGESLEIAEIPAGSLIV